MRRRARSGVRLLTLGMAVAASTATVAGGTVPAAAQQDSAGPAAAQAVTADGNSRVAAGRRVTLLTGDRVLVQGTGAGPDDIVVRPASGRERVRFQTYTDHGDQYVVPVDAQQLINTGRLDRRLFNVTKLVELGYDDSARRDIPLIVSYSRGSSAVGRATTLARIDAAGAEVVRDLSGVGASALREDKDHTAAFWKTISGGQAATAGATRALPPNVAKIWLNGRARATLDKSVPQIGAPAAWQAGLTGQGVRVAVLDTGIDQSHPDLSDAVVEAKDFSDSASGTKDAFGHGTHVASIITGSGAASGGRYKGVAPDAQLVVGKVLDDEGFGFEDQILAGMEWAAGQKAAVVNMSLGSPFPSDGNDLLDQAVNSLTAATGTLFVTSAGNFGPYQGGIGAPAAADSALTVGAVGRNDALATFSSRGPLFGSGAIKPEITAPGVNIVAARAAGAIIGAPVGEDYLSMSGTSMAAPHVTGAAALLAGQHPKWTAEQLKSALVGSATPNDRSTVDEQGAGRVDVGRAVTQAAYTTPAVIDGGVSPWPHNDGTRITRTITYHNDGTSPMELDLTADLKDPAGQPAPAGMLRFADGHLTVPAEGTAQTTVIIDPALPGPEGRYTGVVQATGGSVGLRTPLAMTKEPESYDVTVQFIDQDGDTTGLYDLDFVNVDTGETYFAYDPSGTLVARLPKGHYYFPGYIWTPDFQGLPDGNIAMFAEPDLVVTGDRSLVLDARAGRQAGVAAADRPEAEVDWAAIGSERRLGSERTGFFLLFFDFTGIYVVPSTTSAPADQFSFQTLGVLAKRNSDGLFWDSPYLYHLYWEQPGRTPDDPFRTQRTGDLAAVDTTIASVGTDDTYLKDRFLPLKLPARLKEYYTPGHRWFTRLEQLTDGPEFDTVALSLSARTYTKRHYTEVLNAAVVGPAFPDLRPEPLFVTRTAEDTMFPQVPLFSESLSGSAGFSLTDSRSTTLLADGVPVEQDLGSGEFPMAPEEHTYTLDIDATRRITELSTRVHGTWVFRSGHVDEETALPMLAVQAAPKLDAHNRAPAGCRFTVPLRVERQVGPTYGTIRSVTAQASFDDGKTWQRVTVNGSRDNWTATLTHPARGKGRYVSLKLAATDSLGNSVEETIIRAYGLTG